MFAVYSVTITSTSDTLGSNYVCVTLAPFSWTYRVWLV